MRAASWFATIVRASFIAATLLLICGSPVRADVRLPRIFSNHMMLQCERPIRFWGWADPGESVAVSLNGQQQSATTDARGTWLVEFPAMPPGGPYTATIEGRNKIVLNDVLLGEVWLGSGQSNMAWPLSNTMRFAEERDAADYPKIRLFWVPEAHSEQPLDDLGSKSGNLGETAWHVCAPKTVGYFSAVGLFFARDLHQGLGRPVGIIISAVNGTRIEPWTAGPGPSVNNELSSVPAKEYGELYNAMIHPLDPFAKRGVIWYQGEGNVGDGMKYLTRMEALVSGWRRVTGDPEMPFYFVQLAPLNWGGKPLDFLPRVWEAQTAAFKKIPHTGMVITNDIGNTGDPHPRNKQAVGRRLADWALRDTYGKSGINCEGPIYRSMAIEGNKIRLQFDFADGLKTRGGESLKHFQIAGDDRQFVPAEAEIDGNAIVVSSERVPRPAAVRFAWHQTAVHNLINGAGLPASPFRTDSW